MAGEMAGTLSERVRIEQRSGSVDGAGALVDDWTQVAERWAQLIPAGGDAMSTVAADTWLSNRQWRVILRSGLTLDLGMRLSWRDRTMRIIGIDDNPLLPDRTVLLVEEWGR
jgi:head-tail adaptor